MRTPTTDRAPSVTFCSMRHDIFYTTAATVIPLLLIGVIATRTLHVGEFSHRPMSTYLVFGPPIVGETAAFAFLFLFARVEHSRITAILAPTTWGTMLDQLGAQHDGPGYSSTLLRPRPVRHLRLPPVRQPARSAEQTPRTSPKRARTQPHHTFRGVGDPAPCVAAWANWARRGSVRCALAQVDYFTQRRGVDEPQNPTVRPGTRHRVHRVELAGAASAGSRLVHPRLRRR